MMIGVLPNKRRIATDNILNNNMFLNVWYPLLSTMIKILFSDSIHDGLHRNSELCVPVGIGVVTKLQHILFLFPTLFAKTAWTRGTRFTHGLWIKKSNLKIKFFVHPFDDNNVKKFAHVTKSLLEASQAVVFVARTTLVLSKNVGL